jgi:hypothetical protein
MPRLPENFQKDAASIIGLLVLIGALFHALPSGYWRADDPALLWHAMNSKGLQAFYNPANWQKLSANNLTPWLTFSFKLDLWLAGLSPKFFYLHALGSLALVSVAAYVLNRLWLSPLWATLSVGLFLSGAPTASVTELLMTRHYLEGLLFALLSVIAFVLAARQQRSGWAIAGSIAYALACSAKEIYVPLVLVLLLLPPIGHLKTRLKLIAPYLMVAMLYVFWRKYMLGVMVGGYADTQSIFSMQSVSGMVTAVSHFPAYVFGSHWVVPSLACGVALTVAAYKKPRAIPAFCALALGVFLPLVPLIAFPGIAGPDRYLFLFWFVASFACVLSIHTAVAVIDRKNIQRISGACLCLLLISFSFVHTLEVQKTNEAMYREFDVQGRFYFESDRRQAVSPTALLLHGFWYVTNLCDIKKHLSLDCPATLIKGVPTQESIEHLFAYDSAKGAMLEVPLDTPNPIGGIVSIDTSRNLRAAISVERGEGRWRLGPYDAGQYYFASPLIGRYAVAKNGVLKTPLTHLAFYVQYESPEGWATSSPLLTAGVGQPVTWERVGPQ